MRIRKKLPERGSAPRRKGSRVHLARGKCISPAGLLCFAALRYYPLPEQTDGGNTMRKPDFRALKTKVIDTKDDAAELARRAHDAVSERAEKAREEYSLRRNKPIFMEDIKREDYQLPNIIQVVDDDARKEKLSCESAIGFDEGIKEAAVFTFLTQFADDIGVSYYPSLKESIYYVDPVNPYH